MDKASFFEYYYDNAEVNSIMILDNEGFILDVNKAFSLNFGYNKEDLIGKNFCVLYIQADNKRKVPQNEISRVLSKGQSNDENYVVNKRGIAVWCTGESILVKDKEGNSYIVKDIFNLQSKRQLQLFLKGADEILERIFESSNDLPMMIIDGSIKIQRVNTAFLDLFELSTTPENGSRLSDLEHDFWKRENLKPEIRAMLIENKPLKDLDIQFFTNSGEEKTIRVNSKIIERQSREGRQIFIILEDVTAEMVE